MTRQHRLSELVRVRRLYALQTNLIGTQKWSTPTKDQRAATKYFTVGSQEHCETLGTRHDCHNQHAREGPLSYPGETDHRSTTSKRATGMRKLSNTDQDKALTFNAALAVNNKNITVEKRQTSGGLFM